MIRCLLFSTILLSGLQPIAADRPKPNIVLIFTDDQGFYDLSAQGHPTIKTPNIDRLAKEGTRFTDFYVAASICIPSRRAMMTGVYPDRKQRGKNVPIMPAVLKQAGYATGLIGKWHLGSKAGSLPTDHGIDEFFGTLASNNSVTALMRGTEVFQDPFENSQLTQTLTREALNFIDKNHEQPFFLYLAHNAPHWPIPVSKAFEGKSEMRKPYGDSIEEIDWSVGQILDRLKHHELTEKTLVIYTSDNGPRGQDGGAATPHRGNKWGFLEGSQRVPCLTRWPGRIPAGKVCDEVASSLDFLPTFAHLAGAQLEESRIVDGQNAVALYTGERMPTATTAFFYYGSTGNGAKAIRSGRWKFFVEPFKSRRETIDVGSLFDLEADPSESTNVAVEHPELVARFQKLAAEYHMALKEKRKIDLPTSPLK